MIPAAFPENCMIFINTRLNPCILPIDPEFAMIILWITRFSVPEILLRLNTVPPGAVSVKFLRLPPVLPVKMVPPADARISSLVSSPIRYAPLSSMGFDKVTRPLISYRTSVSSVIFPAAGAGKSASLFTST